MNLKSKIQPVKLPNFLVYYKFSPSTLPLRGSSLTVLNQEKINLSPFSNHIRKRKVEMKVIGMQANSQKLTSEWLKNYYLHQETVQSNSVSDSQADVSKKVQSDFCDYYDLSKRLKAFIEIDKEIQTNRHLRRVKIQDSAPSSLSSSQSSFLTPHKSSWVSLNKLRVCSQVKPAEIISSFGET